MERFTIDKDTRKYIFNITENVKRMRKTKISTKYKSIGYKIYISITGCGASAI